jgi:hypothetical protein
MVNETPELSNSSGVLQNEKRKLWSEEEDNLLIELAEKYGCKKWYIIAKSFYNKTAIQCASRYKVIRPGLIKGFWTEEEDRILLSFYKKYKNNWCEISKRMKSRNGKQIRDRYINILDPKLNKSKFSKKEDKQILDMYMEYGSAWSFMSTQMPGRSPDMIKNRFYSNLINRIETKISSNPPKNIKYKANGRIIINLEDGNDEKEINREEKIGSFGYGDLKMPQFGFMVPSLCIINDISNMILVEGSLIVNSIDSYLLKMKDLSEPKFQSNV